MKNKQIFPLYIHCIIYFVTALLFSYYLDIGMTDDGLRHISFAANQDIMKNWGEVFPHSLFSNYDPWYLWHKLIELILEVVPYDSIHIFINTLSLFTLMLLLDKYLKSFVKYDFGSLSYIIIFSIVYITAYRYWTVRPDLLSGLFVFSALLFKNRFLPVFILTILYAPFYYLFFLYTGSVGLVYIVLKKWRALSGIFVGSLVVGIGFLVQDYQSYLETVKYILTDQSLRMGLEVGEGKPIFGILAHLNYFILLPLFLGGGFILIFWKYRFFSTNTLATFLVITSILWFNQYRYFHLFMPFITIYLISVIVAINKKLFFYKIRKYLILLKRYTSFSQSKSLFYFIAIPYVIAVIAFKFSTTSLNKKTQEAKFFQNEYYTNKTILLNNLNIDLYKALYYNPTIHFVPSCSIGWFDKTDLAVKDIYIRMQKNSGVTEEELSKLISFVKADIYIHYLKNAKQKLNFDKLKQYGIVPYEIYNNRIIFNIKKREKEDG
ncbi:MAG: hypothetical protein U9R16_00850 [Campylobacterota bacterium]|nr:hypothetical protein [Campylobacterota bacterium]